MLRVAPGVDGGEIDGAGGRGGKLDDDRMRDMEGCLDIRAEESVSCEAFLSSTNVDVILGNGGEFAGDEDQ